MKQVTLVLTEEEVRDLRDILEAERHFASAYKAEKRLEAIEEALKNAQPFVDIDDELVKDRYK